MQYADKISSRNKRCGEMRGWGTPHALHRTWNIRIGRRLQIVADSTQTARCSVPEPNPLPRVAASSARIAGVPVAQLLEKRGEKPADVRARLEEDLRYANITIIEAHDASQYGIGIVSARIAEIVLGNEHAALPIGSYQRGFGVTLSLPSVVGRAGVVSVLEPELSADERAGLEKS